MGNGCEAVFKLRCASGAVELRENYGFSQSAISRIEVRLAKHVKELCTQWERIHGFQK
jgi:hypothetical protein